MLDRTPPAAGGRQTHRIMALRAASPGAAPFVFFPDYGGNVLYARKLAGDLPAGVAPHALPLPAAALADLDKVTIPSLCEAMARRLFARWRDEPVHLVGFSFAGILAVETARYLQKLGGRVAHVWLLDCNVTRAAKGHALRHPLGEAKATLGYLRTLLRTWRYPAQYRDVLVSRRLIAIDLANKPDATKKIIRALYAAMDRHWLSPWSGAPLTLFRADGRDHLPEDMGWRWLSDGTVTVCHVSGEHMEFLERPDSLNRISAAVQRALRTGKPTGA